jgi:hypothetical protein
MTNEDGSIVTAYIEYLMYFDIKRKMTIQASKELMEDANVDREEPIDKVKDTYTHIWES